MSAPDALSTHATRRRSDVTEARWTAMGSTAHVIVVGGSPGLVDHARRRLAELEARWSRFRPDSEIGRLRAVGGRPALVSPDTFRAVQLALEGHRVSGGRFDPTLGAEMERLGYDRDRTGSWASIGAGVGDVHDGEADGGGTAPSRSATCRPPITGPAARDAGRGRRVDGRVRERSVDGPGASAASHIHLDARAQTVTVPAGVLLDLGGVGKGLAADLLVAELMEAGAAGACVNVGGDLRVAGAGPRPGGWSVRVDLAGHARHPGRAPGGGPVLALAGGGVATSSRRRRRWRHEGRDVHHLIDPAGGDPARSGLVTVAVAAATAGQAEILATAALVAGPGGAAELIADGGGTGVLVDDDGRLVTLPGWKELTR